VTRSSQIAEHLGALRQDAPRLLQIAAERDAQDAAPGDMETTESAIDQRLAEWRERWEGLERWFVADGRTRPQSELLRATALSAIPRLLQAVSLANERRAGRSDRAADFRHLARSCSPPTAHASARRIARGLARRHPRCGVENEVWPSNQLQLLTLA
jgi:uncharacterized protein (TIGR02677 family)